MARELNMPLQTASDWLSVMRGRGHVISRPMQKDRRSYRIELTRAGREAHEAARLTFEQGNRLFLRLLPKDEPSHRADLAGIISAAESAHTALINRQDQAG
jgi:DNA-binding MarR family transcriptional regulator